MRILLVLVLLLSGCARKAAHKEADTFTFVAVPMRVAPDARQTVDGPVQQMIMRVVEVREGRYDKPEAYYDFDEGTIPPLKVGQSYLFVAGYGMHGIYYSKVTELKTADPAATAQRP